MHVPPPSLAAPPRGGPHALAGVLSGPGGVGGTARALAAARAPLLDPTVRSHMRSALVEQGALPRADTHTTLHAQSW